MKKVLSFKELKTYIKYLNDQSLSIGYLHGAFDILHKGHVDLFEEAKKHCDRLIVGVDTDEYIKNYKYARPVFNKKHRSFLISQLNIVDGVIAFEHSKDLVEYYSEMLKDLSPNLYFTNSQGTPHHHHHTKRADDLNVRLVDLDFMKTKDSSKEVYNLRRRPNW